MNNVILMGRLTKDPEIRRSANGVAVAKFTLAVDRFTKDGEKKADFIYCTAFNKTAEVLEKFGTKGLKILVNGSIQSDTYEKDGQKRTSFGVVVRNVEFCEKKQTPETQTQPAQASAQTPAQPAQADGFMSIPDGIDDELPFN